MPNSRRHFLKFAGLSMIGLTATPVLNAYASGHEFVPEYTTEKGPDALTAKHWGMVIDTRRFESEADVEPIVEACNKAHNIPVYAEKRHEIKWIWPTEYKHAFPDSGSGLHSERIEHAPILVLCNHCENPPCVRACPTQATFKRASDGIVMMDFHRCIGCRFCMAACPFGSRSFNFRDPKQFIPEINPKYPRRTKGVVEKCNFCAERLAVGKLPACVEASDGAIAFGDLADPHSEVRELIRTNYTIRRKQNLGTEPSVYYIV